MSENDYDFDLLCTVLDRFILLFIVVSIFVGSYFVLDTVHTNTENICIKEQK